MIVTKFTDTNSFLNNGGELGKLTREFNWADTSLGEPENWPQSLRTTLSIILNSSFPMFLWWGSELICFYNDAYRPSLGINGKHPSILGMKAAEAWPEIWDIIKPLIDQVLEDGESVWSEDQLVPIYRNGKIEDVYWTFSYSPVIDESHNIAGVLVTCTETTDKINAFKNLQDSEERFRMMADNIPNLAWMANADGYIYWYNTKWYQYTGTTAEQMKGWGWQSVHDPAKLPHVLEKWKGSIATGDEFEMVFPIKGADGNFRQFLTRVSPVKDNEGKVRQWFGTNTDISKQKEIEEALQESKDQLEFAIEATGLGTWEYNPLTNRFSSNERLKKWFGLAADEHIELTHAINAILEGDRQRVTEAIQKALDFSSEGNYDIEYTIIHSVTKNETIVRAKGKAFFNDEKIAYRFNGTLEDITEQSIFTKKIRESEERYHNLIHSSPSAIGILYGEDLLITIANDAFIEIWGKGKEIMGKAYFEALPELAEQGHKEVFAQVYKTGIPFNAVETPVNILQGGIMQQKYYNFLLYPQRNLKGEIDGIGIIATEVTSQAILNNKVKESEKRFRLLADSMPQHVWTSDPNGNLNYFNKSVYDYSGLSPEQIDKNGWIQIVHPDDRDENVNRWINSVSTGNDFLFEHRFLRHDGEYRWQLSRAVPLKGENGKVQMWVGTSTDIQAIKELDQQKDYFIHLTSHELKTPITTIKAYVQMLQETPLAKGEAFLSSSLAVIDKQIKTLTNLISELLDLSKIKTGRLSLKKEAFLIDDLVSEIINEINHVSPDYEITFSPEKEAIVNADRERIGQVLINLITNAIKYSPNNKKIRIKSFIENNNVIAVVKDYGIGINKSDQRKIFDRFYRVEGKSEKTFPGFGIGLFIASEIVTTHNGKIWVESEPGGGSTFYFSLPLFC